MREEAIYRIWAGGPKEGATNLASTWLIGALVIRLVPEDLDSVNPLECSGNLSTSVIHVEVGKTYGCDSLWSILIPFNSTREEALELAGQANLTTKTTTLADGGTLTEPAMTISTAIVFDFVGYQQANSLLVHTRAVLSLPRGGSVRPRLEVSPIDPRVHKYVLPLVIIQSAEWIFAVTTSIFFRFHGHFWFTFNLVQATLLTPVVVVSYLYLRQVGTMLDMDAPEELLNEGSFFTSHYLPSNLDTLAGYFNLGMSLLGFYCLFFICFLGRYFKDISGLEVVVTVLSKTYIELLCLGLVFAVWTIGFISASMVLFGPTVTEFSRFFPAAVELMQYFFWLDDFRILANGYPIVGTIFYFTFQLFILFFALNLLIAVLTAPLTNIKKVMDVETTLLDKIEHEVVDKRQERGEKTSVFDPIKFWFYSRIWVSIVNLVYDAKPHGVTSWLKLWKTLDVLFPDATSTVDTSVSSRLDAALSLLKKFEDIQPIMAEWQKRSELYRYIVGKQLIKGKVSLAIVLGSIIRESRSWMVRDARLLGAAHSYQRYVMRLQGVMHAQEELMPKAKTRTSILATKLRLARECAHKAYASTTLSERLNFAKEVSEARSQQELAKLKLERSDVSTRIPEPANEPVCSNEGGNTSPPPTVIPQSDTMATSMSSSAEPHSLPLGTDSRIGEITEQLDSAIRFRFGEALSRKMVMAPLLLIYSIAIVAVTMWFINPFFTAEMSTSFLVASAEDAIGLDAPFLTGCVTEDCSEADSFMLTLEDVGNLADM